MSAKNFAGDISTSLRWFTGSLPAPITQAAQTRDYAHTHVAQPGETPFSL